MRDQSGNGGFDWEGHNMPWKMWTTLLDSIAPQGLSASHVAEAEQQMETCKRVWEKSGAQSIDPKEVELAREDVDKWRLKLKESSADQSRCNVFLKMACLRFCLSFRRWPIALLPES